MNPIQNSKIVGNNISSDAYLRQELGVARGHPQFVMHRSELMLFASCPSRWLAGYTFKDTDATFFGSLFDCLVTSPLQFADRYIEQPKTYPASKRHPKVIAGDIEEGDPVPWSSQSKWCKQWLREHKDKESVVAEDLEEARQATKRFTSDPKIKELLDCSDKQVMCIAEYHDESTGFVIPTKVLIDLAPKNTSSYRKGIGDIKTIRNAAHKQWLYAIDDRDYDAQGAFNLDHYNAATGEQRTEFYFPLCENVFPFEPGRRMIEASYIEEGRKKYLAALRLYCQCLKTNKWPGFDDDSPWNGWTLCEPDSRHSNFKR